MSETTGDDIPYPPFRRGIVLLQNVAPKESASHVCVPLFQRDLDTM